MGDYTTMQTTASPQYSNLAITGYAGQPQTASQPNAPTGYSTVNNGNGVSAPGPQVSQTATTGSGGGQGFDWGNLLSNLAGVYNSTQQVTGQANGAEAYKNYEQQGMGYQQGILDHIMSLMGSSQGATGAAIGGGTAQGINAINNGTQQGVDTLASARSLGTGGNAALLKMLGIDAQGNSVAPDYTAFQNSPGYKFAVEQGQNAINRSAAAGGNLYSTATLANLANYTQGAASQNYNNYLQNLINTASQGNNAAANTASLQQQGGVAAGGLAQTGGINTAQQINDLSKAGMSELFNTGTQIGNGFTNLGNNANTQANAQTGSLNNLLTSAGGIGGLLSLLNLGGVNPNGANNAGQGQGTIPALLQKLFGKGTATSGGSNVGGTLTGAGNALGGLAKLLGGNTGATDVNGNPVDMTQYDFSNWGNQFGNPNAWSGNSTQTGTAGYDPSTFSNLWGQAGTASGQDGTYGYDPNQGFTYGTGSASSSNDPFGLGIDFSQFGSSSNPP